MDHFLLLSHLEGLVAGFGRQKVTVALDGQVFLLHDLELFFDVGDCALSLRNFKLFRLKLGLELLYLVVFLL